MEFKVIWSGRAQTDLAQICGYVSDNPQAAEELGNRILDHADLLSASPELGPVFGPSGDKAVRSFVEGNYRVFYRIDTARRSVRILHIRHSARQAPRPRDFDREDQ